MAISVIIPLVHGRGEEIACIQSWTHQQRFPRDQYQVVLVTKGDNSTFEQAAIAQLQPHDRVVVSCDNMHQMYDDGAKQAESRILFFTELHCIGDPDCLAVMDQWLRQHPDVDAACARSLHANSGPISVMLQMFFEKHQADWDQPTHWRKVMVRGFAIRKELYDESRGFEGQLTFFADVVLSARLHRLGHQIPTISDSVVTHMNCPDLAEDLQDTRGLVLGEHRFRLRGEALSWEEYLGLPAAWAAALSDRQRRSFRDVWVLLQCLGRRSLLNRSVGRLLLERLPSAIVGPRWQHWKLCWKMKLAQWRFQFSRRDLKDRFPIFEAFWNLFIQQEQVRLALAEPLPHRVSGLMPQRCDALHIPLETWSGVYGLEQAYGRTFRWTKPMFRLRWQLPKDQSQREIVLDTEALDLTPQARLIGLFWNGRRLRKEDISGEEGCLRIRVEASNAEAINELLVICEAIVPTKFGSADPRRLGLPIFGVECRVADAERRVLRKAG